MNEVAQVLGKKNFLIIGSEIWYVFDFPWNIVVIIVQSRLKLYDFTILAAEVESLSSVRTMERSCACLIELKLNLKRLRLRYSGCGRSGKNNTQTTGKAIQRRLHGIRFLSGHLDLLEHRATTSAGKPVSILRVIADKNFPLPSFLVVV